MSEKNYKEKIEIAKKAVEGLNLDDNLKLKAFEKVLDDLLGNRLSNNKEVSTRKTRKSKKKIYSAVESVKDGEIEEDIMSKINAEDFPKIHNLTSKLDLSLYLLKVLREKYKIDGLISSQIAKILSEKFRIKANQFNIGMILSKSKKYLDRDKVMTRGGIGYKYKIMKSGEDYLDKLIKMSNKNEP